MYSCFYLDLSYSILNFIYLLKMFIPFPGLLVFFEYYDYK